MIDDSAATERLLALLQPYASNWSGTLGRGDLVIPQREVPDLIRRIIDVARGMPQNRGEASALEIFQTVSDSQRLPSMQDQVARLQKSFLILKR
ncbi:MAG TPA: hypothetical protein VEB21_03225 [Terriglobales bacterium]|nr:hypothetical protein [Terriglobales bacterium]